MAGKVARIYGKAGYNAPPRLHSKYLPARERDLPVYKPTRGTFVHELPRNELLFNPAVKYPIYNRLPKFWRDEFEYKRPLLHQKVIKGSKQPQHEGLWHKDHTGVSKQMYNFPVKLFYPPESEKEIWAGEAVIFGYKPAKGDIKNPVKFPRTWRPLLRKQTFYSEILDRHITTKFSSLALDLIDEAFGFDNFILQTHSKVLQKFGSSLKREMLLKLARKETDLFPNDPQKQESIYEKYKKHVISEEEAEWTGLTLVEAMEKQWEAEKSKGLHTPLLEIYAKELKAKLAVENKQSSAEPIQVFDMTQQKTESQQRT
uniref:Large ribosomal subunit protein bL28m n=1 Tax=Phallusia mammillata TaxID=59560 RepID=A0A6F9DLR7_9ASCI|nr:39S ribosomal protein L28, mitochondrial-like [Phallusia mammillata]